MIDKNTTDDYNIEAFKLNYRACIPLYVLLDKRLSGNEKVLYGLIEQMESSMSDVFINDRSLCKIIGVSFESRILGKMQKKLKDFGYIKREEREVTLNGKNFMAHCWNIVNSGVFVSQHMSKDITPPVPQVPTPPVPEVPTPPVPQVPTYNTHDLNTLDLKIEDAQKPQKHENTKDQQTPVIPIEEQIEIQQLFKRKDIKMPAKFSLSMQVRAKKAIEFLDKHDLNLEGYLDFLYENCNGILCPYTVNGNLKEMGFTGLLGISFIKKALNDKFLERE